MTLIFLKELRLILIMSQVEGESMEELKELIKATLTLFGYLGALLVWFIAILLCVAVVLSLPIFIVAAVYKIICLICHMAFSWEVPILIGIGILAIFGLTGMDEMME